MIPRIKFQPKDRSLPVEMERSQFPVRLCFAVTSNKSQGQSIAHVGLFLGTQQFFSHGQVGPLINQYLVDSFTITFINVSALRGSQPGHTPEKPAHLPAATGEDPNKQTATDYTNHDQRCFQRDSSMQMPKMLTSKTKVPVSFDCLWFF